MALVNKHKFTDKVHTTKYAQNPEGCLESMKVIVSCMNRDNTNTNATKVNIKVMRHLLDVYEGYTDIIARLELKEKRDISDDPFA